MQPERMTSSERAIEILCKATHGTLSLVEGDRPYAIPMNHCYSKENHALYFHGSLDGKKNTVMAANGHASFCAVLNPVVVPEKYTTYYDSAIATGTIRIVTDPGEKGAALQLLCDRLCPNGGRTLPKGEGLGFVNIYRMDIHALTGKANRG